MSQVAQNVNNESASFPQPHEKDMRAKALDLAARGFRVFKLGVNGRTPLVAGFITSATEDAGTVNERWTEPFSNDPASNNIGVLTGEGFFVLDVDVKKGKRGLDSLATLEMVYDLDLDTMTVRTPSGGLHLFYKIPAGLRINNSVAKLGDGIDVRGHHGYVVGVGSQVNGGEYVWERDVPMLDAPKALLDLIAVERKAKTLNKSPLGDLDTEEAISRATYYLACEAPEAVEGAAGDHTTFQVACRVLDFGISKEQAFELLADWNERKASPPWELADLIKKIDNAWNYRAKPIGVASAKAEFDPIDIDVGIHPDKALDALMNGITSETPAKGEQKRSRLYWLTADNSGEIEDQPYLVQGLINQRSMIVTYGESNSGKTNVVLDRALHIATGRPYAGKRVHQGAVLYIAAEGGVGIRRRIKAWFKKKEIEGDALAHVPFALIPCPIDLLRGLEDTKALINMAKEVSAHYGQPVVYVVIDTLSRALAGGDENSSVDLGTVVKHCDALRAATGAAVDVIHHSGKNKAAGARGHSLLRAATDTELEIEPGVIRITKQRDMDFGPEINFALDVVPIGVDSEGELVESVVVRITDEKPEGDSSITKAQNDTLFAIAEMLEAGKPESTALVDCPFRPMHLKTWLENDAEWKKKVKPETARRYCQQLREFGRLRKDDKGDWFLLKDPFE
jgi:AAA domain/Bifunctional DNA primase/polymerase, N-terminal